MLGGHVRAVFTLVTFIFVFCVSITITSFREVPLGQLEAQPQKPPDFLNDDEDIEKTAPMIKLSESDETLDKMAKTTSYGSLSKDTLEIPSTVVCEVRSCRIENPNIFFTFPESEKTIYHATVAYKF